MTRAGGTAACRTPKGAGVRKVRAPQDRITDNVRRRRLPGKCNRNSLPKLPDGSRYRWKGEVKAHRHGRQLRANVNPIRSNTVCGVAPPVPREPRFAGDPRGRRGAGPAYPQVAHRRAATRAADRWQSRALRVQNPAYKPAHLLTAGPLHSAQIEKARSK